MKKIVILAPVWLLTHQIMAQGTVYISNLSHPTIGSYAVGSDSWIGLAFSTGITGPNEQGYVLDSIQLSMADATGNPSGFKAAIYDGSATYQPQSSLAVLEGSASQESELSSSRGGS